MAEYRQTQSLRQDPENDHEMVELQIPSSDHRNSLVVTMSNSVTLIKTVGQDQVSYSSVTTASSMPFGSLVHGSAGTEMSHDMEEEFSLYVCKYFRKNPYFILGTNAQH